MTQQDQQVRPFSAVLTEIGGGKIHARLSAQLAELTAAVRDTGKKGEITIKVRVEPLKKADQNTLVVTASSTAKVPEGDDASPTSVFFADASGNLRRDDPTQPQLPLAIVPGKATA
ncbi:hypothetical protein GCM10009557_06130 [Virgisporangium ochraceum]|uniref:Uncharacterized protein n=1 Tax=Virgisporangium ochraceum TaxID=65505 RepID=A0A8J3ZLW2_9ACTN|nr:hypothetical protein [Virgisporangium ochraceum]GIJ66269.1 hypothetical protein Voc01_011860 [Virgisporangium ochraceum]